VPLRDDHEVTIAVRKSVHHNEGAFLPTKDEIFSVLLFLLDLTEKTPLLFLSKDIIHSPWRPEMFHRFSHTSIEPSAPGKSRVRTKGVMLLSPLFSSFFIQGPLLRDQTFISGLR